MDLQYNFDELQKAANYLMMRARLRPAGIGGIIFGFLAIIASTGAPEGNASDTMLLLLGLFLLLEGIWCLASPSPVAIVLNAGAIGVVGIWNIAFSLANTKVFWIILGLLQLRWAWQSYKEYRAFSQLAADVPSEEAVRFFEPIIKELRGKVWQDPSRIVSFVLKNIQWRGKLLDDGAVFTRAGSHGILIAKKENVLFLQTGEFGHGKGVKASATIGRDLGEVIIPPDDFRNYEAWKASTSAPPVGTP